ncbi:hypothetical protein BDV41DRAFT_534975 [Aspergillus transmontanensis]|uniref:Uncharacterized protein n=1 Tax=Aspergillus transmontanensis TaxID=1034304 RepID=A0A5N6W3U7_9EURO|nr:hypothetical protein BDV41DRAFT_534975 [Aspergillus transmontanensis]
MVFFPVREIKMYLLGDLFYSVLINDVPSNTYRTGLLYVTVLITKVLLFTVNQSIRRRAT